MNNLILNHIKMLKMKMILRSHYAFTIENTLKGLVNLVNAFYVQDKQIITVKTNLFLFVLISVNKK
jgi:hypothetical protein